MTQSQTQELMQKLAAISSQISEAAVTALALAEQEVHVANELRNAKALSEANREAILYLRKTTIDHTRTLLLLQSHLNSEHHEWLEEFDYRG